jgi:hypothetical protein
MPCCGGARGNHRAFELFGRALWPSISGQKLPSLAPAVCSSIAATLTYNWSLRVSKPSLALVLDLNLSVRIGADPPKCLPNICADSSHAGHFMKWNSLKSVHSLLLFWEPLGRHRSIQVLRVQKLPSLTHCSTLPLMLLLSFPLSGLTSSNSNMLYCCLSFKYNGCQRCPESVSLISNSDIPLLP